MGSNGSILLFLYHSNAIPACVVRTNCFFFFKYSLCKILNREMKTYTEHAPLPNDYKMTKVNYYAIISWQCSSSGYMRLRVFCKVHFSMTATIFVAKNWASFHSDEDSSFAMFQISWRTFEFIWHACGFCWYCIEILHCFN